MNPLSKGNDCAVQSVPQEASLTQTDDKTPRYPAMTLAKRVVVLVSTVCLLGFFIIHRISLEDASQVVRFEQHAEDGAEWIEKGNLDLQATIDQDNIARQTTYPLGIAKPPGSIYSRGLVMGRLSNENTTWFKEEMFPELRAYVYIVDDLTAELHTPENKGDEAMAYLTYIIDNYDTLPDISIFMHAHQLAWHNNEILNYDTLEIIRRLSSERVTREGYMNLRCHWGPGCPVRNRPGAVLTTQEKIEEAAITRVWAQWFPQEPVPDAIGTPCCAQFAVSRDRIHSIPKARFEYYRNWLLQTSLENAVSGRVFEYLWHKIFTDEAQFCPSMRVCYCDGYGVCFRTQKEFDYWFELRYKHSKAWKKLKTWRNSAKETDQLAHVDVEQLGVAVPNDGQDLILQEEVNILLEEMSELRLQALKLGTDPRVRAEVAGRQWKEGDGF